MLITTERNRIYAITSKNRMIASCFCVITVSQAILGLYLTVYAATRGGEPATKCHPMVFTYNVSAEPILPISLQVYMICIFVEYRSLEIIFTTMSLVYGAKILLSPI